MPQIGQEPGSSRTISGCIGQVHSVFVAATAGTAGSSAMPHFGQAPGRSLSTSGSIGQIHCRARRCRARRNRRCRGAAGPIGLSMPGQVLLRIGFELRLAARRAEEVARSAVLAPVLRGRRIDRHPADRVEDPVRRRFFENAERAHRRRPSASASPRDLLHLLAAAEHRLAVVGIRDVAALLDPVGVGHRAEVDAVTGDGLLLDRLRERQRERLELVAQRPGCRSPSSPSPPRRSRRAPPAPPCRRPPSAASSAASLAIFAACSFTAATESPASASCIGT